MLIPKMKTDISRATIPAVVEPKLDGEFAMWNGSELVSRIGNKRYLPLCDGLPKDVKLMGELYLPSGKRNFYQALHHLKTNSPMLSYAVFGMYGADMPYRKQIDELRCLLALQEQVKVVEGMVAYSHAEVEEFCAQYIKEGYEGAVVKPAESTITASWIKCKPDEECDLVVVAVSRKKESVAVGYPDGRILGHCSIKGRPDILVAIKDRNIIGRDSEHFYINPVVVVEVSHLGFIHQGKLSLRSPRIRRVREDIGVGDINFVL